MADKDLATCEFLQDGIICTAVKEKDGKAVREECCINNSKETCCYFCDSRARSCKISCNYLEARAQNQLSFKRLPKRAPRRKKTKH